MVGSRPVAAAESANLYANVRADGTLLSGNGVSSVATLGEGQYEVTFTQDVTNCAYLATTEKSSRQGSDVYKAMQVYTAGGHGGSSGVYVETKTQKGALRPAPFAVVVACSGVGTQYAVVGYSGNLVRSTSGTALTAFGFGRYELTFAASVKACAYVATVGDPSNGAVPGSVGVYTGTAEGGGVYVETKNAGGGLADGVPFHLAAICPDAPNAHMLVVNADGVPTRGSTLTSSSLRNVGKYTVTTSAEVTSCATIVTRGSVDTAVPYTPSTVEWVPRPGPNAVGIQVRKLLFFGGEFDTQAFHTAIIC